RDQTPITSSSGSKVKRALLDPFALSSQISMLFSRGSLISTAMRVPSGEIDGFAWIAGLPIRLSSLPVRSTHDSTDRTAPGLVLYTSVPLSEAATEAQKVDG